MKNSKATTLQFESDFDFETANAQFKDDLTKAVVGMHICFKGYCKIISVEYTILILCVAVEKIDSGDALDSQGMQEEETPGEKYYDKAKGFFDNISSDLKPR